MKILVAPDSFKGSFTASQVARAIAGGVHSAGGTAILMPVADGGEGTLDALAPVLGADQRRVPTVGPWGDPITAEIGLTRDGTAIIELASASGLHASTARLRDPVAASTYGTGMLVAAAIREGARTILVATGGSATTDGGAGAIRAIDESGGLRGARMIVLSDVTTRFSDAARVFGPQKGAKPDEVSYLTARLEAQAQSLPRDPRDTDRTGAAGGFSGGMWAYYGAELVSGADFVLDKLGINEQLGYCSAVVVGEGRLDSQTAKGKAISAILDRAQGLPVYAVVGSVGGDLGTYSARFADVIIASDRSAQFRAGQRVSTLVHGPAS